MIAFWVMMCGILWLAAGWMLWQQIGMIHGIGVLMVGVVLQLFFVESLSGTRGRGFPARFKEWLGVGAAAVVGAAVGILAVRSVVFFRESWEVPLTAGGGLLGMLAAGVVYVLGVYREERKARDEALSGLLIGVFLVCLTIFVLARLSLVSTQPDWLFRFPRNKEVRMLWSSTEWAALLLLVWTAGAGCLTRLAKGFRVDRRRV